MRPLSRGWNKCQYLDVARVLHACRAQCAGRVLIQDSNTSPAWHVLYGIYDMPVCRRKTLSHCFTTRTNRAGNSLWANRTRSGCLSPLSPHTLKSGRGTSCLQAWARESRAFPRFLRLHREIYPENPRRSTCQPESTRLPSGAFRSGKTIYRALGCSGFARVDLFLTPDQKIVFNEVNTIPGLHLPQPLSEYDESSGFYL